MPFDIKKVANHGLGNPIVARLSLQILELLKQTNASKEVSDAVGDLYLNSLMKKLLRCWEINEAFKKGFDAAVQSYKPPASPNAPVEVPQIERLEEECHNFLYEAKNYIRDLLKVVNALYGTSFTDASEFSKAKKGGKSLIEFATETFGADDARTKMLFEIVPDVEELIAMRNAIEHPDGYSGKLVVTNFQRDPDQKLSEPAWHRVKDEKNVRNPTSIRSDIDTYIYNLLQLGEDIFVSWANENLSAGDMMQIAHIPEEMRNPQNPARYTVAPGPKLQEALANLPGKN